MEIHRKDGSHTQEGPKGLTEDTRPHAVGYRGRRDSLVVRKSVTLSKYIKDTGS